MSAAAGPVPVNSKLRKSIMDNIIATLKTYSQMPTLRKERDHNLILSIVNTAVQNLGPTDLSRLDNYIRENKPLLIAHLRSRVDDEDYSLENAIFDTASQVYTVLRANSVSSGAGAYGGRRRRSTHGRTHKRKTHRRRATHKRKH